MKMSISNEIKAINNKIKQIKLNTINADKLLRYLLYHPEMLVNMNF